MYTHRLFLKDGHTFMTDADRALMEQCKVDAQQSAAAAVEAAAKAQEHADSIDTARIDASIALKGDSLYYDRKTKMLYLASNGEKIGEGIPITANINNAELTLENTTGWTSKTISNDSRCNISFKWSSVEDGVSTGPGTVVVKVNNELQYTTPVDQKEHTIDIGQYLILGHNLVHITVTDFYGNNQTLPFAVTVYDPAALKSTRLVEKTLSGDYTNDRVTYVSSGTFNDLTLGKLSLPSVIGGTDTTCDFANFTADEVELASLTETSYWMFNGSTIGLLKLPSVTKVATGEDFRAKRIDRVVMNSIERIETLKVAAGYVVTFDFHKIKYFPKLYENSGSWLVKNLIIRTPSVCTLGSPPASTTARVFVPSALVEQYKTATNWSVMADRIFAIEDNMEFCGGE